jgi:hypothetical protein
LAKSLSASEAHSVVFVFAFGLLSKAKTEQNNKMSKSQKIWVRVNGYVIRFGVLVVLILCSTGATSESG